MKTRFLTIGIIASAALLLSFSNSGVKSNGAPAGSTGAPDEQTCAKSGCHSDAALNSGQALLSLDFDETTAEYEPGKTYNITVSLAQNGINRFGYQMLALRNSDNTNTGEFIVTDSTRTQIFEGYNLFADRYYMTYKYAGTEPYGTGLGLWNFQWTAPATDEGAITLYLAAVAANNDGTDVGDTVYTNSLTLQPKATGIHTIAENIFSVFPNPSQDFIYIEGNKGDSEVKFISINGITVYHSHLSSAKERVDVSMLESGIYFIDIINNNTIYRNKIFIN